MSDWPLEWDTQIVRYRDQPCAGYPVQLVKAMFQGMPLDRLHLTAKSPVRVGDGDQDTPFHRYAYAHMDEGFLDAYRQMVTSVAHSYMDDPSRVVYQRVPTFRFHLPGRRATKEYHRDSDYQHPKKMLNVIVACTRMIAATDEACGNSVRVQMDAADELYLNPDLEEKDMLLFMGGVLRHGSPVNDTKLTRVSFDFRLLYEEDLPKGDVTTVSRKVPLRLGDYYARLRDARGRS